VAGQLVGVGAATDHLILSDTELMDVQYSDQPAYGYGQGLYTTGLVYSTASYKKETENNDL
jgi:hypothetical protein